MDDKIPLIYILSNGRSGSTLLDMLLGSHSTIWSLGEAQILPWEVRENRLPCGCGKLVEKCNFWQPVLSKIPLNQGEYPIEYFREKHTGGRAVRWKYLHQIFKRSPSKKLQPAIDEYGRLNATYFRVVREAAQEYAGQNINWLVDASKDVYRLFWLQHSGYFNLRIIHLVKDPRAFVYSMVKKLLPVANRKVVRFVGRWLFENGLYAYYCRNNTLVSQTKLLQYETFASNPQTTMDALGHWLGLEFPDLASQNFRQKENHAIAGNPMRWQSTQIFLDEKWRQSLPASYARFIWATTCPLARKLGYPITHSNIR
jgi:hypothetical protein